MQQAITILGNSMDDKYFNPDSLWLKTRKWEKGGLFYKKFFKIHKWKHLLPDGAKVNKNGFRKKHITSHDQEYLKAFVVETGRAEIIHWLQILPFWIFGFWSPSYVICCMLGYALLVNIPCILAQRYNRPRLRKVIKW
ncbi:glycosyl-4,4'-diaponeurosporenoate acyltransferase CrtO family protein [Clostridium sp. DL1XJH146]